MKNSALAGLTRKVHDARRGPSDLESQSHARTTKEGWVMNRRIVLTIIEE